MKNLRLLVIPIVLLLCFTCRTEAPRDAGREDWVSLFNGKDLTGWDLKISGYDLNDNYNETFRVEDSILRVDYSKYKTFEGKFGHIYYHEPFSYYRIRLQYRFDGKQLESGPDWGYLNSGIMLHSQSAKSVNKNQTFPVSLEMQLLAGDEQRYKERHTGNLCSPGTQVSKDGKVIEAHCIDSDSETYLAGQWVTAEAIVLGDSIIHQVIEGDTVLSYQHPIIGGGFVSPSDRWTGAGITDSLFWINKSGSPLSEGYISLQAESHPVAFRKIELLNLKGCTDPKAINYKSYFIKSDNSQCRYK